MEHSEVKVGAYYTVSGGSYPGKWQLVKKNPVNVKLKHAVTGKMLNAHPSFLSEFVDDGKSTDHLTYVSPPDFPLEQGTIVKGKNPKIKGLYVVVKTTGDYHSIMPLGGGSAGWRRLLKSHLTVVPVAELADHL